MMIMGLAMTIPDESWDTLDRQSFINGLNHDWELILTDINNAISYCHNSKNNLYNVLDKINKLKDNQFNIDTVDNPLEEQIDKLNKSIEEIENTLNSLIIRKNKHMELRKMMDNKGMTGNEISDGSALEYGKQLLIKEAENQGEKVFESEEHAYWLKAATEFAYEFRKICNPLISLISDKNLRRNINEKYRDSNDEFKSVNIKLNTFLIELKEVTGINWCIFWSNASMLIRVWEYLSRNIVIAFKYNNKYCRFRFLGIDKDDYLYGYVPLIRVKLSKIIDAGNLILIAQKEIKESYFNKSNELSEDEMNIEI